MDGRGGADAGAAERIDVTQYARLIERVRMAASMAQRLEDHAKNLRREAAALRAQAAADADSAAAAKEEEAARAEGKADDIYGECAAVAVSAVDLRWPPWEA